jgi:hypothetical protein
LASSYPTSLDALPTNHNDGVNEIIHAATIDDIADAINKIEAELGTLPKGSFADVKARLAKPEMFVFSRAGALVVAVGQGRLVLPFAATIVDVRASVGTAPVGAAITLDVNKNGSTIFVTQANRPSIAAGANVTASPAVPNTTAFAAGDYITVDIDVVGSTTPGSDLTVTIQYTRA